MDKKRKLKRINVGYIVKPDEDPKRVREEINRWIIDDLIKEGCVNFSKRQELPGYTIMDATIYAIKIFE